MIKSFERILTKATTTTTPYAYHADTRLLEIPSPLTPPSRPSTPVPESTKVEITAKLYFLHCTTRQDDPCAHAVTSVHDSVRLLLKKLDVKAIDMLIVSFCGLRYREDEEDEEEGGHAPPTLDQIVQVWEALEKQVRMKRVHKLGVCEFSLPLLKAFCARVHVKPAVNQIRLADCCVLPRDLVEFAQEYQVELLNHSDERDLVPEPALTELLNQHLTRQQGHVGVCPRWLSKYSVVIPSRGVVSDKGFILAAQHVH